MSLPYVEKFLFKLKNDDKALQDFRRERRGAVAEVGARLTAEEANWLIAGDVLSLYRAGVQPVLLVGALAAFDLDPSEFRRILAPAKGVRRQ